MKPVGSGLRHSLGGVLGQAFLESLFMTVRIERTGLDNLTEFREAKTPIIFVFWHGRLLPLVHAHRRKGTAVLVSEHGDGEYIARIIQRYGFQTVRGSSTRGRVRGLRGLIRAARRGHDLAVTPDGPRGPSRSVKAGALIVARLTGLPLIPVGVAGTSIWTANSWDRFMVPKPFSTVRIAYGRPSFVSAEADQAEIDAATRALQSALTELSEQVGDRIST